MSKEQWFRVERALTTKSKNMDTVCSKFVINDGFCEYEFWGMIGKTCGRWVWVELKVSLDPGNISNDSAIVANLKRELLDSNKRMLFIICEHASELLQSGERTVEEVTAKWIGTRFEPSGKCEALKDSVTKGKVTSPLDAFAKLIQSKIGHYNRITEAIEGV